MAGEYNFDCIVSDDFGGENTYQFVLTVAPNDGVEAISSALTITKDNQTATVQTYTLSFSSACSSTEDDVIYDLKYGDTSVLDTENVVYDNVTFDSDTKLISFRNDLTPLTEDNGLTYEPYVLTLECSDPFHETPETVSVEITIIDSDKHPIILEA